MNRYEEGMKLIEESCGNKKDNALALSTIATEPSADGFPRPSVRDVSAIMKMACFMLQHQQNQIKCSRLLKTKRLRFQYALRGYTDTVLEKTSDGF